MWLTFYSSPICYIATLNVWNCDFFKSRLFHVDIICSIKTREKMVVCMIYSHESLHWKSMQVTMSVAGVMNITRLRPVWDVCRWRTCVSVGVGPLFSSWRRTRGMHCLCFWFRLHHHLPWKQFIWSIIIFLLEIIGILSTGGSLGFWNLVFSVSPNTLYSLFFLGGEGICHLLFF